MNLGAPQLIYLALFFMGAGTEMMNHGKPREGEHNFFIYTVAKALVLGLLYWGGFFG